MSHRVLDFLNKHSSLVITTHENPDPDGIGAELVFSQVAGSFGKKAIIVNSAQTPGKFRFLDPENIIKTYDEIKKTLPKNAALVILDTTDEYNIGKLKEFIPKAKEVYLIDHHEHNEKCIFDGFIDNTASSTCELTVEIAIEAGVRLAFNNAIAAFAGIVYDTGFFAYNKTTARTFKAAQSLAESGVNPYKVYQQFLENFSTNALLLEKTVLSTLQIMKGGKIAVQILRKEDLENFDMNIEDAEDFINTPLKSREIEISILIKQNREGLVRCSLRSKGKFNVAKVASSLGGGGHYTAAGYKSKLGIDETLNLVLEKIYTEMGESD